MGAPLRGVATLAAIAAAIASTIAASAAAQAAGPSAAAQPPAASPSASAAAPIPPRPAGTLAVTAPVGPAPAAAAATRVPGRTVSLSGSMGERALLVIDGTPHLLAPGGVFQGVKLLRYADGEAEVDVEGQRARLRLGVPVNLSAVARPGAGTQIVLTAGSGGHFVTAGSINGKAVDFLVDTGATTVAISQVDADRIGLKYRSGGRGLVQTANGAVPVNFVRLDSVRIGDVEVYGVDATVVPAQMAFVLLGNSFLTRFQMRRDNDQLTLDKRL